MILRAKDFFLLWPGFSTSASTLHLKRYVWNLYPRNPRDFKVETLPGNNFSTVSWIFVSKTAGSHAIPWLHQHGTTLENIMNIEIMSIWYLISNYILSDLNDDIASCSENFLNNQYFPANKYFFYGTSESWILQLWSLLRGRKCRLSLGSQLAHKNEPYSQWFLLLGRKSPLR